MKTFITNTFAIPTNGIRLHAEAAGNPDGPLLVLLHGFPESWYGWRNQIAPLARSGFFVVAPDQRGYGFSSKPQSISAYTIDTLAADILGLLDFFQREQAVIIGHDWGAAVAWHLAIHHPKRVQRLGILNVPHPAALARALSGELPRQMAKSWYIGFFQAPFLPEAMLRAGNFSALRRALRATGRKDAFNRDDLRRYTEAWAQPGALTAMLNWYRAAVRDGLAGADGYFRGRSARVTPPTLILWGERDMALAPELAPWSLEMCDHGQLVRFPNATHWLQHDEPERVTARILDFLMG
jgi:pimeloyl-ACP methyl ester carboxylesterase